jgi:hypothetical protein
VHIRVVVAVSLAAASVAACNEGNGHPVEAPVAHVALPAPAPASIPVVVEPAPQVDPLAAFVGRYGIAGTMKSDTCGGGIYLAANAIDVASPGRLRANVVNRAYGARVEGGRLVAEGSFPARAGGCEEKLYERWTLDRVGEGLEGELLSEWPLPPSCSTRCRVVFSITASRTAGEPDE